MAPTSMSAQPHGCFTGAVALAFDALVGETPTTHAFAVSGASTFDYLPDVVIHAQKEAAHRPEKPWISTSNVLFGPDQIRVLYATITAKEAS